jgi:hypothetical protein
MLGCGDKRMRGESRWRIGREVGAKRHSNFPGER